MLNCNWKKRTDQDRGLHERHESISTPRYLSEEIVLILVGRLDHVEKKIGDVRWIFWSWVLVGFILSIIAEN